MSRLFPAAPLTPVKLVPSSATQTFRTKMLTYENVSGERRIILHYSHNSHGTFVTAQEYRSRRDYDHGLSHQIGGAKGNYSPAEILEALGCEIVSEEGAEM